MILLLDDVAQLLERRVGAGQGISIIEIIPGALDDRPRCVVMAVPGAWDRELEPDAALLRGVLPVFLAAPGADGVSQGR